MRSRTELERALLFPGKASGDVLREYIRRTHGTIEADPCLHGHFDCALWKGGPCVDECMTALDALPPEREVAP